MWRPAGCGAHWAAFGNGAVEAQPTLEYQRKKSDKTYVEAPGQHLVVGGAVEAHPTLEYHKIKGDKTCGGPLAAFSSGAEEAHPTLEYPNK